jgi:hypothetical protein
VAGRHKYFISDRSGWRFPWWRRRVEWNGSEVGDTEYEAKHPQLDPKKIRRHADYDALGTQPPDSGNNTTINLTQPLYDILTMESLKRAFTIVATLSLNFIVDIVNGGVSAPFQYRPQVVGSFGQILYSNQTNVLG